MDDAIEIFGDPDQRTPIVITCEHATNRVPAPLEVADADLPYLDSHWGWDIGARWITREIARICDGVAVLSRFSRLVCDANRDPEDPTWIVEKIGDHVLSFNDGIDDDERKRRRTAFHEPYHAMVDRLVADRRKLRGDTLLLSVHAFDPAHGDEPREMDVGVLYDAYGPVAERLERRLQNEGFSTALNEPYSGLENLIYSANRHGQTHGVVYLELEVRQDLIDSESKAVETGKRLASAVNSLRLRRADR